MILPIILAIPFYKHAVPDAKMFVSGFNSIGTCCSCSFASQIVQFVQPRIQPSLALDKLPRGHHRDILVLENQRYCRLTNPWRSEISHAHDYFHRKVHKDEVHLLRKLHSFAKKKTHHDFLVQTFQSYRPAQRFQKKHEEANVMPFTILHIAPSKSLCPLQFHLSFHEDCTQPLPTSTQLREQGSTGW